MNHYIRNLTVDLRLSPTSNTFAVQQQISQFCRQSIEPAVEPIFDELSQNRFLQIDRLELDLGALSLTEHQWENKLTTVLREALHQRLHEWLATAPATHVQSRSESVFAQWVYFLQTGRLSWSAMTLPDTWQVDVLTILANQQGAAQQLQKQLRTYSQSLQRLIHQHSDTFLKQLVEAVTAQSQDLLLTGMAELIHITQLPKLKQFLIEDATDTPLQTHFPVEFTNSPSPRQVSTYGWTYVLTEVFAHGNRSKPVHLLQRLWHVLFDQRPRLIAYVKRRKRQFPVLAQVLTGAKQQPTPDRTEQLPKAIHSVAALTLTPDQPARMDKQAPVQRTQQTSRQEPPFEGSNQAGKRRRPKQPWTRSEVESANPETAAFASDSGGYESNPTHIESIRTERVPDQPDDPAELAEGFFLTNAGIVLLHPFIDSLFRQVGLLEGFRFRDETAQQKAMLLLHYAATGQTNSLEYNLLLPKVLCGWPLNRPLDHTLSIDPAEAREVDELLNAAVKHWGALGNTSPDALREGFLQRTGKLRRIQGVWWLQVETQTLDILLDRLPYSWGFNHIMLPWMPELLRVEWR